MKCEKCGYELPTEIQQDLSYCPSCGTNLKETPSRIEWEDVVKGLRRFAKASEAFFKELRR